LNTFELDEGVSGKGNIKHVYIKIKGNFKLADYYSFKLITENKLRY